MGPRVYRCRDCDVVGRDGEPRPERCARTGGACRFVVRALDLRARDRVYLARGVVRTVAAVAPTIYAAINGETILVVQYAEGPTPQWGEGNTTLGDDLWWLL